MIKIVHDLQSYGLIIFDAYNLLLPDQGPRYFQSGDLEELRSLFLEHVKNLSIQVSARFLIIYDGVNYSRAVIPDFPQITEIFTGGWKADSSIIEQLYLNEKTEILVVTSDYELSCAALHKGKKVVSGYSWMQSHFSGLISKKERIEMAGNRVQDLGIVRIDIDKSHIDPTGTPGLFRLVPLGKDGPYIRVFIGQVPALKAKASELDATRRSFENSLKELEEKGSSTLTLDSIRADIEEVIRKLDEVNAQIEKATGQIPEVVRVKYIYGDPDAEGANRFPRIEIAPANGKKPEGVLRFVTVWRPHGTTYVYNRGPDGFVAPRYLRSSDSEFVSLLVKTGETPVTIYVSEPGTTNGSLVVQNTVIDEEGVKTFIGELYEENGSYSCGPKPDNSIGARVKVSTEDSDEADETNEEPKENVEEPEEGTEG